VREAVTLRGAPVAVLSSAVTRWLQLVAVQGFQVSEAHEPDSFWQIVERCTFLLVV